MAGWQLSWEVLECPVGGSLLNSVGASQGTQAYGLELTSLRMLGRFLLPHLAGLRSH